jgi:hypothetical protein
MSAKPRLLTPSSRSGASVPNRQFYNFPMANNDEAPLAERDKINILLHEYDTLRTEIIHRTNNMFQVIAGCGVLFVWILSRQLSDVRFWLGLILLLALAALFSWLIRRDINKAAARLRELEADINVRAKEPGLLRWESKHGGAVTGYWGAAQPLR